MYKIFLFIFFLSLLSSCQKFESFQENDPSYSSEGYFIKTSLKSSELGNFKLLPPRSVQNISDMYADDKYLYVAEYAKGVHFFKNPNSKSPEPLFFLSIPAMRKFIVKDGHLICDNGNDLIAFKIKGLDLIEKFPSKADSLFAQSVNFGLINRKKDLFEFPNYPLQRNVYFECPDSVDFVLEWEKKIIDKKLNCYR